MAVYDYDRFSSSDQQSEYNQGAPRSKKSVSKCTNVKGQPISFSITFYRREANSQFSVLKHSFGTLAQPPIYTIKYQVRSDSREGPLLCLCQTPSETFYGAHVAHKEWRQSPSSAKMTLEENGLSGETQIHCV